MAETTKPAPTRAGQKQPESKKPRGKKRRLVVPAALLLLLLVGVYFVPAIVAHTPLRQRIIPMLFPKLAAESSVGSASLGWFSPVVARDVRLRDPQGGPLLEAPLITSQHTLAGLLLDRTHLGAFTFEKPLLHIKLRQDGSNVGDAIRPMFTGEPVTPRGYAVEIVDGTIDASQPAEARKWQLSGVRVTVDLPLEGKRRVAAKATVDPGSQAEAADALSPAGSLDMEFAWNLPPDSKRQDARTGEATVDIQRLPLELAIAALQRFSGDVRLAGDAGVKGKLSWNGETGRVDVALDDLQCEALRVAAPQWLAEDEVAIGSIHCRGGVSFAGDDVRVNQLALESSPASLKADGTLKLADFRERGMLDAIFDQQLATSGKLDLAKLAAMLPATLRIREGTRITSGTVDWDLAGREDAGRRRVVGRLDATGLAAENAGQTIAWQQPIQMTLAVENSSAGLKIEQLECRSSFLDVRGSGTLEEANLTASCSLDQLGQELGQFVDLGGRNLSGQLASNVAWTRSADGQMSAKGTAAIDNLLLELPGGRPWQEQHLAADFDAAGRFDENGALGLDKATLQVRSGNDLLDVQLLESVANVSASTPLPLHGRLAGRIATWLARLQMLLPLEGWQIDGQMDFEATGNASLEEVDLATLAGQIQQLAVRGPLNINEPLVKLDAKRLAVQLAQFGLQAQNATLASSSLAMSATGLRAAMPKEGPSLSGQLALRARLYNLASWLEDTEAPSALDFFGEATGNVALSVAGGVSSADLNITVDKFAVAERPPPGESWQAFWQEPQITITGKAAYDHKQGAANLDQLSVESQALRVTATGKLTDVSLSPEMRVDLDGDLAYDLEKISPLVRPYLGEDFVVRGKRTERFAVHGPLLAEVSAAGSAAPNATTGGAAAGASTAANVTNGVTAAGSNNSADGGYVISPKLTAEAALGWDSAQVFQLPIGQGQIDAKLRDGTVQIAPLDLPVSGGQLHFAPSLLLDRRPPVLVSGKGKVVDQLQITPTMCRTWLKYVAPAFADATTVEGQFSADLAGATVPLTHPLDGDVQGDLIVHSAKVGPGPMGREIRLMVRRVESLLKGQPLEGVTTPEAVWITMPEQTVEFQMAGRRVEHKQLAFLVGDVEVQTSGSVGFDESLDMLATVQLRDDWVAGPLLSELKGRALKIPIRGTLSAPRWEFNGQNLREWLKKSARGEAGRLIERGLERLLRPRQ